MNQPAEMPVLYCYDGSRAAKHALVAASAILGERQAVVLSVRLSAFMAVADLSDDVLPRLDLDEIDKAAAAVTQNRADAGALAVGHAVGTTVKAERSVWRSILKFADECNASMIVIGARDVSLLNTLMLGSVSNAIVNHSRRPVLVIPSHEA